MVILVTGAAGHIGSNLAIHLLGEGHFVVGVDNFLTGDSDNLKYLYQNKNFVFIEASVEDPSLKDKLSGYSFGEVYHLACPTGVPNLVTLAPEMLSATSVGTKNILDIALASKSKFILGSSSEVYGDPKAFPQREDYTGNVDSTGIRSPYEEGKRFSESLTAMYFRKYGLDGKIVRIFNTYGPNMSKKDLRVIPQFILQSAKGADLKVHGDGSQKRTFLYVGDLVRGLILVLRKGTAGEVYNIGSDQEISVKELAKLIKKITNSKSKITFIPRPAHDHQSRMPNLSKIKKLGWKSTVTLEKGLSILLKEPQSATI